MSFTKTFITPELVQHSFRGEFLILRKQSGCISTY